MAMIEAGLRLPRDKCGEERLMNGIRMQSVVGRRPGRARGEDHMTVFNSRIQNIRPGVASRAHTRFDRSRF